MTPDEQAALDAHNTRRTQQGLVKLEWCPQLTANAQKWADHLAKDVKAMQHSTPDERPNQGENLFYGWAQPGPFKDPHLNAVQNWMAEEAKYGGQAIGEGNLADWGHYTQCMWSDTQKVGMAMAGDGKGGVYVVGRYEPPGNWNGKKPY